MRTGHFVFSGILLEPLKAGEDPDTKMSELARQLGARYDYEVLERLIEVFLSRPKKGFSRKLWSNCSTVDERRKLLRRQYRPETNRQIVLRLARRFIKGFKEKSASNGRPSLLESDMKEMIISCVESLKDRNPSLTLISIAEEVCKFKTFKPYGLTPRYVASICAPSKKERFRKTLNA